MFGFHSFYFYFLLVYICYAVFLSVVYIKNRHSVVYLILLFLPLVFLSTLRGNTVGGDLVYHYLPNFHDAYKARTFKQLMETSNHEPGYVIFTKIVSYFSNEDRFFLAITGIISLIGPFFLIYKYSGNYVSSVLLYYTLGYYTNTFNNIRQSIAVSLFFLTIPFLINKKPWYYYIMVMIEITFHYSAIPLLLVYPLVKNIISMKKVIAVITFGGLSYMVIGSTLIITIVPLIFAKYSPEEILETSGAGYNLLLLRLFMFCVFFLIFFKIKDRLSEEKLRIISVLLTLQLFALVFQLYATIYSSATRMEQYLIIPTIVLIPFFISQIRIKHFRICMFLVTILYSMVFFYKTYSRKEGTNTSPQGVIPYVFVDKHF